MALDRARSDSLVFHFMAKQRARAGERTKAGRPARKSGQSGRQRATDPGKLRVVREMLLGGVDQYEMIKTLADRWDVTERTIRYWRDGELQRMREEVEAAGFLDPAMEAQLAIERLEALRMRAIGAGDRLSERRAIELRLRIVGVLGPERHYHLHAGVPPSAPPGAPPTPALPPADEDPAAAIRRSLAARIAEGMRSRGEVIDMKPAPTPAGGNE